MKLIREICGNSKTYNHYLKLYNNFEMSLSQRIKLISSDEKEKAKFIEFLKINLHN